MSRLQRAYRQLPFITELPESLPNPVYGKILGTKIEGGEAHEQWARSISSTDICAYSDDSSEGHGRSAWSYILQRADRTFEKTHGIINGGEVYDAELAGAAHALQAAISKRQCGEKIFVLLDNQAAVSALQTGNASFCIKLTRTCYNIARRTGAKFRWIPENSKIRGNEEADAAARCGLQSFPSRQTTPNNMTLAYIRRVMHQRRQILVEEWCDTACPARYQDLDLQMRCRKLPELSLPRKLLPELFAAQSGHGDFAAYHCRFHHENANIHCVCGQEKSPTHFIRCRRNAGHMRKLRKGLTVAAFTQQLLGPHGLGKFIEFARITGCFGNLPANLTSAGCEDSSN